MPWKPWIVDARDRIPGYKSSAGFIDYMIAGCIWFSMPFLIIMVPFLTYFLAEAIVLGEFGVVVWSGLTMAVMINTFLFAGVGFGLRRAMNPGFVYSIAVDKQYLHVNSKFGPDILLTDIEDIKIEHLKRHERWWLFRRIYGSPHASKIMWIRLRDGHSTDMPMRKWYDHEGTIGVDIDKPEKMVAKIEKYRKTKVTSDDLYLRPSSKKETSTDSMALANGVPKDEKIFKSSAKLKDTIIIGLTFGGIVGLVFGLFTFISLLSTDPSGYIDLSSLVAFSIVLAICVIGGTISGAVGLYQYSSMHRPSIKDGNISIRHRIMVASNLQQVGMIKHEHILDHRIENAGVVSKWNPFHRHFGSMEASRIVWLKVHKDSGIYTMPFIKWKIKDGWVGIDVNDPEAFVGRILPLSPIQETKPSLASKRVLRPNVERSKDQPPVTFSSSITLGSKLVYVMVPAAIVMMFLPLFAVFGALFIYMMVLSGPSIFIIMALLVPSIFALIPILLPLIILVDHFSEGPITEKVKAYKVKLKGDEIFLKYDATEVKVPLTNIKDIKVGPRAPKRYLMSLTHMMDIWQFGYPAMKKCVHITFHKPMVIWNARRDGLIFDVDDPDKLLDLVRSRF